MGESAREELRGVPPPEFIRIDGGMPAKREGPPRARTLQRPDEQSSKNTKGRNTCWGRFCFVGHWPSTDPSDLMANSTVSLLRKSSLLSEMLMSAHVSRL